jgi:hypothetical protein
MAAKRIVGIFIIAASLLYAGFLCLLYFSQDSMIYPGTKNLVGSAPPATAGMEIIRLPTAAGNVEALFLPATDAPTALPKPLVIYAHGNGELTDFWVTALDGQRTGWCWDPEHLPFWQDALPFLKDAGFLGS